MADVQLKYKKAAIFEDIYPKTKMANLIDWASALASINADIATRQAQLVSGTNIKTINNTSILGPGNIDIAVSEHTHAISDITNLQDELNAKQGRVVYTVSSTGTGATNYWNKIARIMLDTPWQGCHGKIFFSKIESSAFFSGILNFHFRVNSPISSQTINLYWESLDTDIADTSIIATKIADGVFDIWVKGLGQYQTLVYSAETYHNAANVLFQNGTSWVASYTGTLVQTSSALLTLSRIPTLPQSRITNLAADLLLKSDKTYVHSRGQNLLTNGTALLGNNTNFSAFTFDGTVANSSPGSFRYKRPDNGGEFAETDEFMPVEATKRYKISVDAKSLNGVGRYYMMTIAYDVDNLIISASHHMYRANTLTTLAQPLNNGDTVVYLTNAANWDNSGTAGVNTHLRSIIIWNYTNSYGYTYPPLTYSRKWTNNAWNPGAIDFVNNTITLRVPWAGGYVPAGTSLSNGSDGGTYKYNVMGNVTLTTSWVTYTGVMDGIDYSGTNVATKFPPGTAKIKLGWLMNYTSSGETAWFTNMSVTLDYPYRSEMSDKLTTARQINGVNFDGTGDITIPASEDVIGISEATTGTATTKRVVNALNLRTIIEALSPPGSRPSNDVKTWAKDGLVESATGDVNNLTNTGFYQGSSLTNAPTTGWYFYIVSRYRADANWVHQLAMSFGSGNTANKIYTRTKANGVWGAWAEMYTSANPSSLLSVYRSYVSDLDTQFTPGQYYFDNSTAGKANATTWGWVHVEVNNNINYNATDNWIRQTLQQTDGKKYYRYRINNGAWTAWFQEYNTQYKPTPADIGAVAQSTFNTLNDAYGAHVTAPNPHGITPAGIGAVPDTRTIAGKQLNANVSVAELTAALNLATTSLQGLLSPTDKANLDTLAALLVSSDGDSIVNTINEILAIFANYPEGADLVTALSNKVDKVTGYALSKNDFTDVLKTKLDGISSGAEVNPDVITISEGTTGTATTKRAVSAVNLKSIIEALSPPGARAASSITDAILGSGTTGNAVYLRGDRAWSSIPFSHITGTATESQVPTLQISKISGLQSALDSKSSTGHTHSLDALTEGTTNKFVSQAEKNTWNGKQSALGYTPANKAGDTFTGHVVIDNITPLGGEANSFNITFRYQTGSNPYTKALNVNNGGQLIFDGVVVSMAGHGHAGTDITSGYVPVARLGSGTPSSSVFLRGDGYWQNPQDWAAIGSNSFTYMSSLLATISTPTTTAVSGLSNYKWLIVEIVAAGIRETRLLRYVTGQSVQISAYIAGSWRYITLQTNPSNIVSTSLTGTPTVYVYGVR